MKKKYPIGPDHYVLYEEIGQGVSALVHRALCIAHDEVVAIKILDFERDNCDLNNVSREAQTMFLVEHPNVVKSHCSFVCEHNLWVVMPYMAGGSCLHILKSTHPDGFEEVAIATILRDVLKALEYLHRHGHIHRDVKAGNILIGSRGAIKLGDFGVSACLFDSGDRQRVRNTFVGTPCWMAPEVMEQLHGYDFKADIWSFGITALELAHGHAPFSKYPPMKVLLMTLQNAPPGLDYERDKKFSKSFKQMIASCLVKDPSKRPTAAKLLKHSFFKQGRSNDYIARTLLEGLPVLGDRLQALKRKEEDMLAQKKIPDGQKEEISQNEYKRGISSWNFNLEDLKAQASLIQDDDTSIKYADGRSMSFSDLDMDDKKLQSQLLSMVQLSEAEDEDNTVSTGDSGSTCIRDKNEKYDDGSCVASTSHEHESLVSCSPRIETPTDNTSSAKTDVETTGRSLEGTVTTHSHQRRVSSGNTNLLETNFSLSKGDQSDKMQNHFRSLTFNGSSVPPTIDELSVETGSRVSKSSANGDEQDDKVKVPVVQQRGRFKVTSENVEAVPSTHIQKSHSMQVISQHPGLNLPSPSEIAPPNHPSIQSFFPTLQQFLDINIMQRDAVLGAMKRISYTDSTDGGYSSVNPAMTEKSLLEAAHDREKELLQEIAELHWRLICAQEELQKYKIEHPQI